MRATRWMVVLGVAAVAATQPAVAQSAASDYRDEFLRQFQGSSRKILMLAEAMPESTYAWSPGEGVMSVARVYMHIARYNYYYLETSLGVDVPADIDMDGLEAITEQARVRELLAASIAHVRDAVTGMTEEDLAGSTVLYGRNVAGWAVLLQLLAHMNEHVGQSIAYARMNGVVPPWSR